MESILYNKENKRFIKFALVGISGTIVDFGFFNVFTILFNKFNINSLLSIDSVILASILSFLIAIFNNYYWNRNWSYPESRQFPHLDQLSKFSTVSVIGLLIRTPFFAWIREPVIEITTSVLSGRFALPLEMVGQNIALGIVIVVVLFWNYFINRYWTYKNI